MTPTLLRQTWFNALITALAPLIWGSTYIVTTELLPPDRPFTAAMLRVLPAGLLLVLYGRQLPARPHWGRLLILAALNIGCFQALLFVAAYRLPGGLAAVVGAIQPLLLMGLLWTLDGQRPAQLAIGASLLGIVGMAALLLSPDARWDALGIAAAFVGMACMALGTYLTRRWQTDLTLLAFTGWQLLLGGLMLLPLALLADPPLPALKLGQGLAYAYLSLFGALLAYVLWFRGIARLSPVAVSSLSLLSPVIAVLMGWALLNQRITGVALIGLLTVLGSILLVQWAARPTVPASQRSSNKSPAMEPVMPSRINHLIETRASTTRYQPGRELPEALIRQLVQLATRAPSAYNLQNWKFIAVQSAPAKARLHALAYQQRQVLDAAVTFIVCGTLAAHRGLAQALQPSVDAGILPPSLVHGWVSAATTAHSDNLPLQRDEALRSASLAAMTLMLAAQGMGLASGAMSGFDGDGVAAAFELTAEELPVMLVTIGYPAAGNWPQKLRKPLDQVLAFA